MKQLPLKVLSIVTTLGMLLVLVMGALVTKTESGEGCGDSWPLCNGEIIPSKPTIETIIEYSHRGVSATVGLLIVIFAVYSWRVLPQRKEAKLLAISSVFFVVLQGLLGAAAVVWSQSSAVLALHFGFSLVSFASVLLLTFLVFEKDHTSDNRKIKSDSLRKQLYAMLTYTYVVVYTGALVRHTDSSLSCKTVPHCGNETYFWESPYSLIQMGHRLAAILLFFWVIYLLVKVLKDTNESKIAKVGLIFAFIFILAQALSGILVVVTLLNLYIALLHAVFISCFFGVISYMALLALRGRK